MLRKIATAGIVVLFLAAVLGSYFGLENYCSLQHQGNDKNPNGANSSEQHAAPQGQQAEPTATFNLSVSEPGKIEGRYYTYATPQEKENWTRKFWCDAKIGEFALVVFTFLLVLFTGGLWLSTDKLWVVTKVTAEHIPIVERAYVYGGFGSRAADPARGLITVAVTLANYGKTPAFVTKVELGFARAEELPIEPSFDFSVPMSEYYFPMMTMGEVRVTMASLTIPDNGDWVVFQRTHYRDVLGNTHFSGCAFRFYTAFDQNRLWQPVEERIALDTPYWATDERKPNKA